MMIVSDGIEHLVAHALLQAGVLITDRDASLLREIAIREYWEIRLRQPQLSQKAVLKKLIDGIALHRICSVLDPKEDLRKQLEHLD